MKHLVDKLLILLACATWLPAAASAPSPGDVAGALLAVVGAALFELAPPRWRTLLPTVFCCAAAAVPSLLALVPLAAYDLARCFLAARPALGRWAYPLAGALPLATATARAAVAYPDTAARTVLAVAGDVAPELALGALAWLLAVRTAQSLAGERELKQLRDTLQGSILHLHRKNAELSAARAHQERAAALAERARIAREIHDNVGHLLTRSIFQVEALQVVRRAQGCTDDDLAPVGATLREALDTVRASVHDLHDGSLDLELQLLAITGAYAGGRADLAYTADTRPASAVAECFAAVTREALANAARHGRASVVHVTVEEHPAFWRLHVADNGSAAEPHAPGLGLQSMRERVEGLGGTFWAGPATNGFIVFATVPHQPRSSS